MQSKWIDTFDTFDTLLCCRCINIAVKKNYFEVAELLVKEYYGKSPQLAARK